MSADTQEVSDHESDETMAPQGADLDQIRQILIGSYSRETDSRFSELSQKISEAVEGLRAIIVERTDSIASKMEHEIEQLHREVESYRNESGEAQQKIQSRLTTAQHELQQQLGAIGQTLSASEKSIRHDTDQGLAEVKDHIREQLNQIRHRMDSEFSRIDNVAVTRRSFRDALREISSQFDSDEE